MLRETIDILIMKWGAPVQRLIALAAFSLFVLLFCSVAANIQKEHSFLQEKCGENPAHPAEKYFHIIEKRVAHLKNQRLASRTGEKEPGSSTSPQKNQEAACKREECAENQDPRTADKPSYKTKEPPGRLMHDKDEKNTHFLLIGRWWEDSNAEMLMLVTLVPGDCARLASLDPDAVVDFTGKSCPIGELLERGCSRDQLYRAVNSLTGVVPQFYIDLNLHGFVEMIDLLQKDSRSRSENLSDGSAMLLSLRDPLISPSDKEEMVVRLLLSACEIQFTRLGWKLLWMGYRNLKTDLSLEDLLELRRITQGIAPGDVTLREIGP